MLLANYTQTNQKRSSSSKQYRNYNKSNYNNRRKKVSVAERKELLEQRRLSQEEYKALLAKVTLADINKKTTKTYSKYTKEKYRQYIQNPVSYEADLRDMSNFLYRVSMPYRRLVNYLSDIPLFYWNLIPELNVASGKSIDRSKVLKNYYKVLDLLNKMSIPHEMRKVLNTTIKEGVFYGFIYQDKNSFFIQKLDPAYCSIKEIEAGCYNFAFDFSYFGKYPTYLDYFDPYFSTLYKLYEKDSTNYRWQVLDPDKSICIKVDADNPDEIMPQLVGMFEALMDLIDARSLQRNKDEIENYKLIVEKIPLFDNTKEVDDYALDIESAMKFYNKLADVVPEAVGVAISPMDIDTIDFKTDDDSADLISNSMRSVFSDSGVAQLLFNSERTGSVGLDASVKVDVAMVWKLVESIQRWIQRYIMYNSNADFFFEILRVDIFNKENACTRELSLANSGVPNKLKLAATNGSNPLETLSAQYFENEILQIHNTWIPLKSSYTMSSDDELTADEPNDEADRNADNNGNVDTIEG